MKKEFRFDIRGYLQPSERFLTTIEDLEKNFVNSFEESETRKDIFEQYMSFNQAFTNEITQNFTHWLDGSFISNKNNPNDLDILILLEAEDFIQHKRLINEKFRLHAAKKLYPLLDIYTLTIFDKNHEQYFITEFDLVYWNNFWGNSKMNRAKKTFSKGYLEIKFSQ